MAWLSTSGRNLYTAVPSGANSLGDAANSSAAPVARLGFLSGGETGTKQTLRQMRDYARAAIRNPAQIVRTKANQIFSDAAVAPRDWNAEVRALHAFVRDKIRYVKDPVNVELVQTPEATLSYGYGDCDDKSTLLAALLEATGHPARFTVIGLNGGPFSHVLAETRTGAGGNWLPLETIIPKPPGWFPSGVTKKYSLKV